MKVKHWAIAVSAALAVGALPAASALAAPSDTRALSITAVVQNQQCMGGDFVNVTLSATGSSTSQTQFAWDFDGNGTVDTGALNRPTVTHTYLDETRVTATVFARNAEGDRARDSVTFGTLNCP